MAARPVATLLRGAARVSRGELQRLTARRYFSLLTQRWADPVVAEPPDLLIRPKLGLSSALRFSQVAQASAIGYRDATTALREAGLWPPGPRAVASHPEAVPVGAVRGS